MEESQNIEWKEAWRDEYIKWIAGFVNASGKSASIMVFLHQYLITITPV